MPCCIVCGSFGFLFFSFNFPLFEFTCNACSPRYIPQWFYLLCRLFMVGNCQRPGNCIFEPGNQCVCSCRTSNLQSLQKLVWECFHSSVLYVKICKLEKISIQQAHVQFCKFLSQIVVMKRSHHEQSNAEAKVTKITKHYQCTKCGKAFTSDTGFKMHSQHHTGQYKHFSDLCGKGFIHIHAYEQHLRVHMGEDFACAYCDKRFISKQRLKCHQSVYTGVYRFKCNVCDRGYNDRSQFNAHMLGHK